MRCYDEVTTGEEFRSQQLYNVSAEEMEAFARRWDPQRYHLGETEAARLVRKIFARGLLSLCINQRLTHESGYFDIAMAAGLGLDEIRRPQPVFARDDLNLTTIIVECRDSSESTRDGHHDQQRRSN